MTSYAGKHASYYDAIYAEKPYAEEAGFIHACLQKYGHGTTKNLLELACGTGRHAFELEKLGYQIIAIDYSPDLLAVAMKRAKELGSGVNFRQQDMRSLSLPETSFDAVYCLFDSIGYVQTNEGIQQVLSGVYRYLRQGGLFIFEFWHAAAMLRNYEPRRERHWQINDIELIRIATTRLEVKNQLAQVRYDFEEKGTNGKPSHFHEIQVNRYFLVQEMALFLQNGGFVPVEWLAGYQNKQAVNEDSWHILAIARRS